MDWSRPFDKRDKDTHRFTIADTHGPLLLTVPVTKPPTSRCRWDEIDVSTHGAWWDVHRVALESAYGRTPYFEFYIDRFIPMLTAGVTERFSKLCSLAEAWDREIRDILGLTPDAGNAWQADRDSADARNETVLNHRFKSYRQIRSASLGFIPGLSVLDLIFNLGPEAQIYLNDAAIEIYQAYQRHQ